MNLDYTKSPTPSEIRAYVQKGRELRAEAAGEMFRSMAKGIAKLFHKIPNLIAHAAHA